MIETVFRLFFTEVTWLIFGSLVSAIFFDYDVKKMPTWWKMIFALPLIFIGGAIFVTILLAIWTT